MKTRSSVPSRYESSITLTVPSRSLTCGLSPRPVTLARIGTPRRRKNARPLLPMMQRLTVAPFACHSFISSSVVLNTLVFSAPQRPRSLETTMIPTDFGSRVTRNGCR